MKLQSFCRLVAGVVVGICGVAFGQELVVTADRPDATYRAGETVTWRVEVKGDADALKDVTYRVRPNGKDVKETTPLAFTDSSATITAKFDEPGWLYLEVSGTGAEDKKIKAAGTAMFSPDQIKPALPCPDDFDEFWAAKIEELNQVPANPVLTAQESGKENVEYYLIDMDNIRGTKIRGQLAKPAREGKFPALLIVQWAGVYPLQKQWATDRAAEGWLTLNIMAHDLPINESAEFYKQQASGPLSGYTGIGNDDRETSYFLRMFLSCYRAADYLTTREDWNGQTLVVTGGSQGGMQAIVTAALHPKVTGMMANVPAGCELSPQSAGRMVGWPYWPYTRTKDKDIEKVIRTGQYFDATNFASRIKCPVLIGVGGIDTTCPPVNVYAMINQITAPKEIVFMPGATHGSGHAAYYSRWGATASKYRNQGK